MSTITQPRTEQVSLRVPRDIKRILQQGASIAGQSLTDFMVACSAEKARELMEQHRVIAMTQEAYDEFVTAMIEPVHTPTPLAVAIIEDYAASVRKNGTLDW
jgi:uncharacterized protein (DUF1778 family)